MSLGCYSACKQTWPARDAGLFVLCPQCRSDLKSDEEIFADKSREVKQLADQLQEMVRTGAV